jgi:hypothetical protein
MADITPELVTHCLNEAQKVASRSVSYIGSKGMIRESHVRF